jgi:hypothetical protein
VGAVEETDRTLHYDFSSLTGKPVPDLLTELAEVHSAIANLAVHAAFLRQEEVRATQGAKEQRLEVEGLLAAFTEKKFLILTLLKHRGTANEVGV